MADDYLQLEEIDYDATFVLNARFEEIWMFLACTTHIKFKVYQNRC